MTTDAKIYVMDYGGLRLVNRPVIRITGARTMNIYQQVAQFAAQWEQEQGYKPAAFQKAIAMQRLERGQSIREIIDALVAMRVS